ncbi:MAG: hypothetical protein ACK56F_24280 [bacterium]
MQPIRCRQRPCGKWCATGPDACGSAAASACVWATERGSPPSRDSTTTSTRSSKTPRDACGSVDATC